MEEIFMQLGLVAALVQRSIAFLKAATSYDTRLPKAQKYISIGLSVILSALICVGWDVDLVQAVGLHFPYSWDWGTARAVGAAVTGVLAALGSNVLNDLLAIYKAYKDKQVPN